MDLSVIICTYNRASSLRRTLASFKGLCVPANLRWELIVVDNNSSDETRCVVEECSKVSGWSLQYVFEPKQGKSHALNKAVRLARGRIIAFTDDDVIVSPDWLRAIIHAFARTNAACVGGKILPLWEGARPHWLTNHFFGYLALLDHGETPKYLDKAKLWGCNFAFRADILSKYGPFDPNLGTCGNTLYRGEDTDFLARLLSHNEAIFYDPSILVHHAVPIARMRRKYFRKWCFDSGVGLGMALGHYSKRNVFGIPLYIFRQSIEYGSEYALSLFIRGEERFVPELELIHKAGFIVGRLQFRNKTWSIRGVS